MRAATLRSSPRRSRCPYRPRPSSTGALSVLVYGDYSPSSIKISRVHSTRAGRSLILKVDTEALPELAQRFGIRSIPTLAVFEHGREASRTAGAMPAAEIGKLIDAAMG